MNNFDKVARSAFEAKNNKARKENKRFSKAYARWRFQCLERDKHCCVLCSEKNDLEVHHIMRWVDNPITRYKKFNGATLCKKCHMKWHNGNGGIFPQEIVVKILTALKKNGQKFRNVGYF